MIRSLLSNSLGSTRIIKILDKIVTRILTKKNKNKRLATTTTSLGITPKGTTGLHACHPLHRTFSERGGVHGDQLEISVLGLCLSGYCVGHSGSLQIQDLRGQGDGFDLKKPRLFTQWAPSL